MIREEVGRVVSRAMGRLVDAGIASASAYPEPDIAEPKNPDHGDFACNLALVAAQVAGMNPRALADALAMELTGEPCLESVEVAGPGFLNLRLSAAYLSDIARRISERPEVALRQEAQVTDPRRINVEFVSVNPNGPITIGSGRGAAYGSALCNVLTAAGHVVHREYYINDGVNSEQMRLFAESVRALARGEALPENGYRGDYVLAVAEQLRDGCVGQDTSWFRSESQKLMIARQAEDLEAFGVAFDTWFSEQSLHDDGAVDRGIEALRIGRVADERPVRTKLKLGRGGNIDDVELQEQAVDDEDDQVDSSVAGQPTLWLRSTKFGDDTDRVLRRRDGRLTYIASDVAYHRNKFNRPANADKLITILGPDHHGYIGRLTAVVAAILLAEGAVPAVSVHGGPLSELETRVFASPEERDRCQAALAMARQKLEVRIFQLVRFLRDGQPAPMRKRDGNIYALTDLMREIGDNVSPAGAPEERARAGRDVARFFYLMRSHDTTFDFDLDLAAKQSEENPVFYVQYAHARICSILSKAESEGMGPNLGGVPRYTHPRELALIKKIADLPYEVRRCASDYAVHRLTTYAQELAKRFHLFYEACRVVDAADTRRSNDRLALCVAARAALSWCFELLGVSAPERM